MIQKTHHRIVQIMLTVLMLTALIAVMPLMNGPAFAATGEPAMSVGADALKKDMNTENAASVYYGSNDGNPYWWRVIGYAGQGAASTNSSVTLLMHSNTSGIRTSFSDTSNVYADSLLRAEIEKMTVNLSAAEQGAIEKKTLVAGAYDGENTDCVAGKPVNDALFWPLSTKEAYQVDNDLRQIPIYGDQEGDQEGEGKERLKAIWWLRSPGSPSYGANVGIVQYDGRVEPQAFPVDYPRLAPCFVRPAANISFDSIVLTSAASLGKPTGTEEKPLVDIGSNPTNDWKLTVKDQAHSGFKADLTYYDPKGKLRFEYSGASAEFTDSISAVITDKDNVLKAYGQIAKALPGNNTIEMVIPEQYTMYDHMYVFNEKINGDKETDYASDLQEILYPNTWTQPSPMTVSGKTVKIRSKANKLNKTKKISAAKAYSFTNEPVGEPAFQLVKASKSSGKFKVDPKTGQITVRKGLKRGTYQLTVKVKDPGNDTCSPVAKNVVVKIKVVK